MLLQQLVQFANRYLSNGKTHNKFWGLVQDIGYGIANMFGQGEVADRIVNFIDANFLGGVQHLNATQLISSINEKFGVPISKAKNLVNLIDRKANELENYLAKIDSDNLKSDIESANLPPALSSQIKRLVTERKNQLQEHRASNENKRLVIQKQQEDLANKRNRVVTDLSKIESNMGTALNLASQQDLLSPSRKAENQNQIKEFSEQQPDLSYLENIERSIK